MNNETCHNLVNKHYPDPVLMHWQPSDYDMKYRYNTPRKLKKLDAVRAKEDAKLQCAYDKAVAEKAALHAVIDRIGLYPAALASLFLDSFEWTIADIERRHDRHLKVKQHMLEKYGQECLNQFPDLKYLFERTSFGRRMSGSAYQYISDEQWQAWANDRCYPRRKCFAAITDVNQIFSDYKTWAEARNADDIHTSGASAFQTAIRRLADTLNRICDEINVIFDGNAPTQCLTDPHWGVQGHFNGVLSDGNKKASFKSFSAGGYNIQCFHYRFKITELKH